MVDWGRLRRNCTREAGPTQMGAHGVGGGQAIQVGVDQVGWGHMGR